MALTEEEKRYNELINGAPRPAAGKVTQKDFNALINAEKAANSQIDFRQTADGKLDAAINDYLNKSGYKYDIANDKVYQDFAKEYSQNALRGRQLSKETANTLANGFTPTYADTVGDEVYSDSIMNYANYYPAFMEGARQQRIAEAAQAGNASNIYADLANTRYSRERDAQSGRMAFMNYLAGRYQTDREADLQQFRNAGNIYAARLGNAASNLSDVRNANNNRYLFNNLSADNSAKLKESQYEFEKKLEYSKAEDAYNERIAREKAAEEARKQAEKEAKEAAKEAEKEAKEAIKEQKEALKELRAYEKEQAKEAEKQAKNAAKYDKDAWKIQAYLGEKRKLSGDEAYDLDYNKDGKINIEDATIAQKAAQTGKVVIPKANSSNEIYKLQSTPKTSEIIKKIESSKIFNSKASTNPGSKAWKNAIKNKIENYGVKLDNDESLYLYQHFGLI